MSSIYQFSETELIAFILVLIRTGSFLVVWPVLGQFIIPTPVKVLLSLSITMCVFYPVRDFYVPAAIQNNFLFHAALESIYGVFLGFIVRAYFFAFEIAADFMSVSMGLNSAQLFNPAMGRSVSAVDTFFVIMVSMVYLGINGHHYLVKALIESFEFINPTHTVLSKSLFGDLTQMLKEIISMGFQIAAPIVMAVFVSNIVMGILGKVVPQINVLVMSMPINIALGVLVLLVSMPLLLTEAQGVIHTAVVQLFKVVKGT